MARFFGALPVPYVYQLGRVPGFGPQVLDYACGPACAAMAAGFASGWAPDFRRALELVGGTAIVGRGTEPWAVARAVRHLAPGVGSDTTAASSPAMASGVLDLEFGLRRPLIALVRPSWVVTGLDHFVVVTAVDGARGQVLLNDPLAGQNVPVPLATFLTAWQRLRWSRPFTYVWVR